MHELKVKGDCFENETQRVTVSFDIIRTKSILLKNSPSSNFL